MKLLLSLFTSLFIFAPLIQAETIYGWSCKKTLPDESVLHIYENLKKEAATHEIDFLKVAIGKINVYFTGDQIKFNEYPDADRQVQIYLAENAEYRIYLTAYRSYWKKGEPQGQLTITLHHKGYGLDFLSSETCLTN